MEISNLTAFPADNVEQNGQPPRRKTLKIKNPVNAIALPEDLVIRSGQSLDLIGPDRLEHSVAVTYEEMQYLKSTLTMRS